MGRIASVPGVAVNAGHVVQIGFALASQAALGAQTYTLDTLHSTPVFEFKHLGVTTQTGRFTRASGTATLEADGVHGSVTYQVDAASLNMGFGAESPDSPAYRLFEVDRFPTITFTASQLAFDQNHRVVAVHGQLTLLGVTRPLTVQVNHYQCALSALTHRTLCAADVSAVVKRSDFGMTQFIPLVSDEIVINVPVEAYED